MSVRHPPRRWPSTESEKDTKKSFISFNLMPPHYNLVHLQRGFYFQDVRIHIVRARDDDKVENCFMQHSFVPFSHILDEHFE
jgi:hypothetical protein